MLSLWKDLDRLGMPGLLGWAPSTVLGHFNPTSPIEVKHDGDHVIITADMPGVDPGDLDVTFEAGSLYITGRRGDTRMRFSVHIGGEYDVDTIEAELDKGVLTLRAERRPEAKPRRIALKGGETRTLASGEST